MHRVSKCLMIAGALALLLFVVRPAAGQISTGSLSGQVVDPSGAAVPNAQVTATNIGTNAKSRTTTDSSGIFHLALLPGGTYNVEVTKTGFQAIDMGNVLVSVGVDHGLGTLPLKVGGVSTVVNVTTSTEALSDETPPCIGIFSKTSQCRRLLRRSPLPSLPTTRATSPSSRAR